MIPVQVISNWSSYPGPVAPWTVLRILVSLSFLPAHHPLSLQVEFCVFANFRYSVFVLKYVCIFVFLSRNNSDASQYGGSQYSLSSATSPLSPSHYSPSHSPVRMCICAKGCKEIILHLYLLYLVESICVATLYTISSAGDIVSLLAQPSRLPFPSPSLVSSPKVNLRNIQSRQ